MPRKSEFDDLFDTMGRLGAALRLQSGRNCPKCMAPTKRLDLRCGVCQALLPWPERMIVLSIIGTIAGAIVLGLYWGFRPLESSFAEEGGFSSDFRWGSFVLGAALGAIGGMVAGMLFDMIAYGIVEMFTGNWLARAWLGQSRDHDSGRLCTWVVALGGLLSLGGIGVMVWGLFLRDRGDEIAMLMPPTAALSSMAFSADGKLLVAVDADRNSTIHVREVATGTVVRKYKIAGGQVRFVACAPNDARLFATAGDVPKNLRLWDVKAESDVREFAGTKQPFTSVVYTCDGTKLLTGSHDRSITLWDATKATPIRTIETKQPITCVALLPDGRRALSGGGYLAIKDGKFNCVVRLWDLDTGQEMRSMEGHTGEVTYVAFTPDTKRALSAAKDKTVRLWDLETGKELRSWTDRGPETALSPDGRRAVSIVTEGTNETGLLLWDVESGTELSRYGPYDRVSKVVFAPDGSQLVVSTARAGEVTFYLRLLRLPK